MYMYIYIYINIYIYMCVCIHRYIPGWGLASSAAAMRLSAIVAIGQFFFALRSAFLVCVL